MPGPSLWVETYISGIASGGRVLDVACGAGRHIALARERGLQVTGVDRDTAAARRAFGTDEGVHLVESDLEDGRPFPFAGGTFDGVIVTKYLWRPILPAIIDAVGPAGVLLYETYRLGNERFGKPSRPDFLLRPGELLAAVCDKLHVVAYEEATEVAPRAVVQHICAVGPRHPWIDQPPQAGIHRIVD